MGGGHCLPEDWQKQKQEKGRENVGIYPAMSTTCQPVFSVLRVEVDARWQLKYNPLQLQVIC